MNKLFVLLGVLAVVSLGSAQKHTHAQALSRIQAAGIGISSSGGCSDRNKPTCTSLEQVRVKTIDTVLTLKSSSGCPVTITGGTEVGHASGTYSHWNGYKLDFSLGNGCIETYVRNSFTFVGNRPGTSYPEWKAASGNMYCKEGNHWDVTYY